MQLEILSGWKDIAMYLGKGVRTVQRYERDLRLPVRRPGGKSWGSVIATKSELDGWISAAPIRAVYRLSEPDDTVGAWDEFRFHMREAHRLRLESAALRASLHESVELLRQTTVKIAMPESVSGYLPHLQR